MTRAAEHTGTEWTGPENLLPRDVMRVDASSPAIEAVFLPTFVRGQRSGGELTIDAASGLWLMNVDAAAIEAATDTAAADTAAAVPAGAVPAGAVPAGVDTAAAPDTAVSPSE